MIIFSIIAFIVLLLLGLVVLIKDFKGKINKLFFLFCFVLALMFFAQSIVEGVESSLTAFTWAKIYALFLMFVPAVFLHFSSEFPKKRLQMIDGWLRLVIYVPSVIFLFFLGNFIEAVSYQNGFVPSFGLSQTLFAGYFSLFVIIGIINMVKSLNEPDTDIKRFQSSYAVIGISTFLFIGGLTDVVFPAFGFNVFRIADILCIVMAGFISYSIRRHYLFVRAPLAEAYGSRSDQKYPLAPNVSFIVKDRDFHEAFSVFLDQILHGKQGICITRMNPQQVLNQYQLKNTPIYWLTEMEVENSIEPTNMEEIAYVVERFVGTAKESVVFFDGFEYLTTYNTFGKTLHLAQDLKDRISMRNSNLLVPLKTTALEDIQLHLVDREFEEI
ncbi:DUF835 domain-containing protein [Candidatus Woesearchaeota archaeon]|nr:DUF835 domain-containing protein [Candidatus Woesearchaeota archaeon]